MNITMNITIKNITYYIAAIFFISFSVNYTAFAQLGNNRPTNIFGPENFAFGMRGGVNTTDVLVLQSFAVFSNSPEQDVIETKIYEKMPKNTALEFGLVLQYKFGEKIKLNFNPGFTNYNYAFANTLSWQSAGGSIDAEFSHNYKTRYLDLPLVLSFHFLNGNIRPYAGAGMYLNYRRSAYLKTEYNWTDTGIDASNPIFIKDTEIATPESFLDKYYGIIANAGVSYIFGGIELALEFQYKRTLLNPVSAKNRYEEQYIIDKTYTVPDDILMQHAVTQIVFTIPVVCQARNGFRK